MTTDGKNTVNFLKGQINVEKKSTIKIFEEIRRLNKKTYFQIVNAFLIVYGYKKMGQVMSREWKRACRFVLFFFFLYNIKSYIFGDLDYVKNRYFKDNDRIYILLDTN